MDFNYEDWAKTQGVNSLEATANAFQSRGRDRRQKPHFQKSNQRNNRSFSRYRNEEKEMIRTLEKTCPEETINALAKAIQKRNFFKKQSKDDSRKRSESSQAAFRVINSEEEEQEEAEVEETSYADESDHTSGKAAHVLALQTVTNVSRLTGRN